MDNYFVCGNCSNFRMLSKESGIGVCMKNKDTPVLDITSKDKRKGCKFEDKNIVIERSSVC